MLKIAIDRGGTFTDIYAVYEDKVVVKKILSESPFYEDSNTEAIKEVFKELGLEFDINKIEWVRLGTTVGTNAILERKGAEFIFVVTKGFRDILEINDQRRENLFDLEIKKPKPLYKKVVEVDERVIIKNGKYKNIKPINEIHFSENVAVMFLHSLFLNENELKIKAPFITRSSEFLVDNATLRASNSAVDAYITPIIKDYIKKITKNLDKKKLYFMQSSGELCKADEFRGINSLLSGPAGGVAALKSIYKDKALIGFDMGGTSTDVSRYDGEIELKYIDKIAGYQISTPTVDIHTVAAGGGSKLFYKNGMFIVGPESSGSNPGPLCYGRDGYLSITDANVVTGRIDLDNFPKIFGKDGKSPLNIQASKEGFKEIAKELNKTIEEVAEAFLDVANENMANAIKEITIKNGYNPSEHILCSFGGAGGQHAVGVARKLGIKKILIHAQSGVLSAFGIANADIKGKNAGKVILKPLKKVNLKKIFNKLEKEIKNPKRKLFLGYKNTNTFIEVEYKKGFLKRFKDEYKRKFGFLLDSEIILKGVYTEEVIKTKNIKREKIKGEFKYKEKEIFLNGKWQKARVYTSYGVGEIKGPALILQPTSTILLDEGSEAKINEYGDIEITLHKIHENQTIKAAKLSIYSNKLTFIAKKMGDILKKTAMSVNIKEREDYSCAIFDKEGNLIVNAPHIPVHLGSMSEVVKSIIKKGVKNATYITNAPYEGGSHLPDITVITPYIENNEVVFWVASRGHHADIGGSVPGSMPPFSKYLKEEGAIIESFAIVEDGIFKEDKIKKILKKAGARKIEENISDIKAQIAANQAGIEELLKLNRDELAWFFKEIKRVSKEKVKEFFKDLKEVSAEDYLDNGAVIKFRAYKDKKIVFDFSGTSPQLLSNQNAPYSVAKSAIIYSIRVMLKEDIPLNDGILEDIEIILPKNSLLNPDKELAVVGGNVTTSQRIVDVIFKAFRVVAASQGCMNNVIFGNKDFGYYETIGGGSGAGDGFNGVSAVHTHMTNTKITDVEVIERRYPVMIEEFSIRKGSGGSGKYKGGDGIKRVYKFLDDMEVSLLTERRVFAPYGLNGGSDGKKGKNLLYKNGKIYNLTGKANFRVKKGDKLIIKTPGGGGWGKI